MKRADTDPTDGTHALSQERLMYYSASWQLLEERIDDEAGFTSDPDDADIDRHVQYMWGPRYIDDIILHREHDGAGGGEDRWYHLTDVQFSTVAILDESAEVAERVTYTAYGRARHHWPADVDGDGDHDTTDRNIVGALRNKSIGDAGYDAAADLNRDGTIDNADWTLASGSSPALAEGVLTDASSGSPDNQIGFDGYVFNGEVETYTVRERAYSPPLGRWLEKDLLDYQDGMNLYEYVGSFPLDALDPFGERTLAIEFNGPQSPLGFSLYGRVEVNTEDDGCVSASINLGVEWQPPGLRWANKAANLFKLHIEIGGRGLVKGTFEFCPECGGCIDGVKICGRFEVFARVEYRKHKFKESGKRKRFTRGRFGAGADGGGEVCWNLCNGAITFGGSISVYAYGNFGWKWFNRSFDFGWSWSGETVIGQFAAPLEDYCCPQ